MRKKWFLILIALMMLFTACTQPTAQDPVVIATPNNGGTPVDNPAVSAPVSDPVMQFRTDVLGRNVETVVNPTRVISLSPATTEILYALDCGSELIAVDTYSNFPAEADALPKLDPLNVAEITALDPQVVFVGRAYDTALIDGLTASGIGVVCAEAADYGQELYGSISLVGSIMGKDSAALVLGMQDTVLQVQANTSEMEPVSVYFALGFGPNEHVSAGEGSMISTLIKEAGGIPVMEEPAQLVTYTTEQLLELNPQVVLVSSALDLEALKAYEGYSELAAIEAGRIYVIDEELLRPGPRVVEGMYAIYEALELSANS